MARTATTEKSKTAQPPAQTEQSAPAPKSADELHADVMRIETELEALPARIQAAKELASDSVVDKAIADALATVAELQRKETTLRIKRWHARRAYLIAAREEALQSSTKLSDSVTTAREELDAAEKVAKAAIDARNVAEKKFKTATGEMRGAAMRAQELAGELQKHEQEKPQL